MTQDSFPYADVGARIAEFGQALCGAGRGWQTKFARMLDLSPANLTGYIKGTRRPIGVMRDKLDKLGADTHYILTGVRKGDEPIDAASRAADIARRAREDALRDGIDDLVIVEDAVKFHIENARTQRDHDRLPYLQMVKAILQKMQEQV